MKFGDIDDLPVIFDDKRAVMFGNGQWNPIDHAEAHFKAKLMSEAEFKKCFPDLPPLPDNVF